MTTKNIPRVSFTVMEKQMTQMLRFKVKTTPNRTTVRKMLQVLFLQHFNGFCMERLLHRIKISNRRATQRCNVSAFFYAKICSLLARRRSSQPVQRVYWPENVIDWLGKWRPTCVMRHARGQKLQSFRRKWPFYMNLYSMVCCLSRNLHYIFED